MVSDFKVLFIIDKPEFLDKEIDVLNNEGYQIATENYSSDIHSKLPAINPDLVVSDIFFLDENSDSFFTNRDKENSLTSFFIFIGEDEADKNLNLNYNWPVEIMIRPYSQKYFLQRVKTYNELINRGKNIISRERKVEEHLSEQKKFDQQRTEFWKIAVFSEDANDMIESLLILLGDFLDLGRISFFSYQKETNILNCQVQWVKGKGLFHEKCELSATDFEKFLKKETSVLDDNFLTKIRKKYPGYFSSVKAQLVILYGTEEVPQGAFMLEEFEEKRKWTDQEIQLAREFSNIIRLKTDLLKYAEEKADSERKFRIISEASRDLICIHNLESEFKYVSPSSTDILGYTPGELTGTLLYDLMHPEDNFPFLHEIKKFREEYSQDNKVEYRIRRKDGSYVWFETIVQPLGHSKENMAEFQTSSRDITSRKLAEEKIRESEIKYRNIFESMHDVYVEIGIETGKILEVSPSIKRFTGYSREELLNRSVEVFDIGAKEGEAIVKEIIDKEKVSDYEIALKVKGGRRIICSYSVRVVRDENGKPFKVVGTLRDISQRKNYEKQLKNAKLNAEAASKAKSEFLANMSHEIRTPLNAILGFSEVLINKAQDPEDVNHLEAILSSGQTLLAIINDILDLSKIEAGKFEISRDPVQINAIIEDIRHIFDYKIKNKGLEFYVDLEKADPPVVLILDEIRVRQILFNLVGNALKFTEKGYIKISVELNKNENGNYDLTLKVSDTGIGIPKKQQRLIFQSFQQQSAHDSRKYEGTGLGLTITQKLIEMMGGEIKLESRIGKGSVFIVNLFNLRESSYKKIEPQKETIDETNIEFHPATVLIADDLQYNIDAVKSMVNSENISFIEAQTAEKAIEVVNIKKPDLILMDVRFPDMSGYEATAFIKAENKGIPVIGYTASTISEEDSQVRKIFDDYLRKPVSKNDLFAKLKKFLAYEYKSIDIRKNEIEKNTIEKIDNIDYKYLVRTLKKDFLPTWELIKDNLMIFKIEDFCNEIKSLADENPDNDLQHYVKQLKKELDEFDINSLETTLKKFPDLINKIEMKL